MSQKVIGALVFMLATGAGGPAAANVNASLTPDRPLPELLYPVPNTGETLASVSADPARPPHEAQIPRRLHHHHYAKSRHRVVRASSKDTTRDSF